MLSLFNPLKNMLGQKVEVNTFESTIERPLTDTECDRLCEIGSHRNADWGNPMPVKASDVSTTDIALLELGLIDEDWSDDGADRCYWLTHEGQKLKSAMLNA